MIKSTSYLRIKDHLQRLLTTSSFALFIREWIAKPTAVGAICPSSRRLAQQIAWQVPDGDGAVVELGGGTGAVTRVLLDCGIDPKRLIVIERSAPFAEHLQRSFPKVRVICGDATRLRQLLPRNCRVDAIVSCLPLRSLPSREAAAIVAQWHDTLPENGVVVQFTYDIRPITKRTIHHADFVVRSSRIIWANLPPARIVTMHKHIEKNASAKTMAPLPFGNPVNCPD
ncbi:MAG: methyltransferase [Herbaspirillum sp.]|nr:methyltransferase [Herbaspirillum sp.]